MNNEPRIYSISETAYKYLQRMCLYQGYISPGLTRNRGMSLFLNDLSHSTFTDTRPSDITYRHNVEIKNGRAPLWSSYSRRKNRMLKLTDESIQNYITIAYTFGIIKDPPYIVGGPSLQNPYAIVGYVLEGIGLKWLTPDQLPVKGLPINDRLQRIVSEPVETQSGIDDSDQEISETQEDDNNINRSRTRNAANNKTS